MNQEIHKIQVNILKELIFNNGCSFSKLNTLDDIPSDHFSFHLKQLLKAKLVEKIEEKYYLTIDGKQYVGRIDTMNLKIEEFGKPSVLVICTKEENGNTYYLMQQRMKEPLFGYFGFTTGKIRRGDFTYDTALRELDEETGLKAALVNLGVFHKIQGPTRSEILLDNYFHMFVGKNPTGDLVNTQESKNSWHTEDEARDLKIFNDVSFLIEIVKEGKNFGLIEKFYQIDKI